MGNDIGSLAPCGPGRHSLSMTETITAQDLVRFGVEGAWGHALHHHVRWHEVDPFGHVNHAAYLTWFENARNSYMERAGLTLSATTPGPVVAQLEIRYLKPVAYNAELLVTARTVALRTTSFTMEYGAWDGGCAALCSARCVLLVNATGARVPIPDALRTLMVERDGARVETA